MLSLPAVPGARTAGRDAAAEDEDKAADARGLEPTEYEEEAVNDKVATDHHRGTDARLSGD